MGKTAFIFPGQGAQYVGMGKDFFENYECARNVYDLAKEATGVDVADICFNENENINKTEYTQIAILATEVAIAEIIKAKGKKADVCAGLSLGEYGALAQSNVMSLEDLFKIVRKRGIYMQNAYPEGGAMEAVIGLDKEKVEEICAETDGIVSVANYNCPGQVVITGEEAAVKIAAEKLKEAGVLKCVPLNVSGPFHSLLLKKAGDELGAELEKVEVKDPEIPYICNEKATYVTRKEDIVPSLSRQVYSSVLWEQSVEKLIEDGVDSFIEIGPGKTLSKLVKKINRNVTVVNVEKIEDLNKI